MKHFNCRELRICSGWSCSHSNSNINFQAMTRNISQNLSSITLTLASIKTKQLQNQPSNQPTNPYFSSPLCPCPPPKKKKGKEIGAYYKIIVSSKLMGLLHFACEMKSCSWEISCSSLSYIWPVISLPLLGLLFLKEPWEVWGPVSICCPTHYPFPICLFLVVQYFWQNNPKMNKTLRLWWFNTSKYGTDIKMEWRKLHISLIFPVPQFQSALLFSFKIEIAVDY